MREGMSQQERERREKLEAISNQLRTYYPSIRLDGVQDQGPKNPPPQSKEKEDDGCWLDDVIPEKITGQIFVYIVFFSIIGGFFWGLNDNMVKDSAILSVLAGIVTIFIVLWIGFLVFAGVVVWPIKSLVVAIRKRTNNCRVRKTMKLRSLWNRMEEGVRCILARKERLVLVIILVAIVLAILLYLFPIPRYTSKVMHTGRGIVYQHDRWTGKSYIIYLDGSRRQVQD